MNEIASTSSMTGASHLDDEPEASDQNQPEVESKKSPRLLSRLIEAVFVLRDFVLLLFGLLLDQRVDRKVKIFVGSVLAYIFAPIDFIPDLLGGLFGVADDFVLTAFALNVLMNWVDPEIVASHWRGKKDLLSTIQKGIRNAEVLIPEAILKKIQGWIGKRAPEGLVPVHPAATAPVVQEPANPPTTKKKRSRTRKSNQ